MGINRKNEIDFRYGPLVGIKSDGSRVVILSEEMLGEDLQIDEKGKLTLNAPKAVEKLSLVNKNPGDGGGLGELFFEYKLVDKPASGITSLFTEPKDLGIGLNVYQDSLLKTPLEDDGNYAIYTDEKLIDKVTLKIVSGIIDDVIK